MPRLRKNVKWLGAGLGCLLLATVMATPLLNEVAIEYEQPVASTILGLEQVAIEYEQPVASTIFGLEQVAIEYEQPVVSTILGLEQVAIEYEQPVASTILGLEQVAIEYDNAPVTAPTVSCPPDTTIACDTSPDPVDTGSPTVSDPNATVSFSDSVAAGSAPNISAVTRTWTATDAGGNAGSCGQTITVIDIPCQDIVDQVIDTLCTDSAGSAITSFAQLIAFTRPLAQTALAGVTACENSTVLSDQACEDQVIAALQTLIDNSSGP
ncbi:MAG: hypothetical protein QF773_00020 [Lentisphaeria bacterium]|nr:hypothetical protein [Lentisphaeria bacterium]